MGIRLARLVFLNLGRASAGGANRLALSLPAYCARDASVHFPTLAVDHAVRFPNLSAAVNAVARFLTGVAMLNENQSSAFSPAQSFVEAKPSRSPKIGPWPAARYFQAFVSPLADEADLWDFAALSSVVAVPSSATLPLATEQSPIVPATDVGAYALLAALFHLSVSSSAPLTPEDQQASVRGRRCARFKNGDVRAPEGSMLCAAWLRPRSAVAAMLDDVWVERDFQKVPPIYDQQSEQLSINLSVEVLKRRVGGARDSLLYTTAHSEQSKLPNSGKPHRSSPTRVGSVEAVLGSRHQGVSHTRGSLSVTKASQKSASDASGSSSFHARKRFDRHSPKHDEL